MDESKGGRWRGQTNEIPEGWTGKKEGSATIVFQNANEVFYNPVQEFNRDLSILALKTFSQTLAHEQQARSKKRREHEQKQRQDAAGEAAAREAEEPAQQEKPYAPVKILEALAATGLRSIRYAREMPFVSEILANDIDPNAVAAIQRHIELNGVPQGLVRPNLGDAVYDCQLTHACALSMF